MTLGFDLICGGKRNENFLVKSFFLAVFDFVCRKDAIDSGFYRSYFVWKNFMNSGKSHTTVRHTFDPTSSPHTTWDYYKKILTQFFTIQRQCVCIALSTIFLFLSVCPPLSVTRVILSIPNHEMIFFVTSEMSQLTCWMGPQKTTAQF